MFWDISSHKPFQWKAKTASKQPIQTWQWNHMGLSFKVSPVVGISMSRDRTEHKPNRLFESGTTTHNKPSRSPNRRGVYYHLKLHCVSPRRVLWEGTHSQDSGMSWHGSKQASVDPSSARTILSVLLFQQPGMQRGNLDDWSTTRAECLTLSREIYNTTSLSRVSHLRTVTP